jgi:hypothetical protein
MHAEPLQDHGAILAIIQHCHLHVSSVGSFKRSKELGEHKKPSDGKTLSFLTCLDLDYSP